MAKISKQQMDVIRRSIGFAADAHSHTHVARRKAYDAVKQDPKYITWEAQVKKLRLEVRELEKLMDDLSEQYVEEYTEKQEAYNKKCQDFIDELILSDVPDIMAALAKFKEENSV